LDLDNAIPLLRGLSVLADAPQRERSSLLKEALRNQKRELIEGALAECKSRVAAPNGAARTLELPRSTP